MRKREGKLNSLINSEATLTLEFRKIELNILHLQIDLDDGLPQNVCFKCFMHIRATFVYRQMCERSDAELREIFQQNLSIASIKIERTDGDQDSDALDEIDLKETHRLPSQPVVMNRRTDQSEKELPNSETKRVSSPNE